MDSLPSLPRQQQFQKFPPTVTRLRRKKVA